MHDTTYDTSAKQDEIASVVSPNSDLLGTLPDPSEIGAPQGEGSECTGGSSLVGGTAAAPVAVGPNGFSPADYGALIRIERLNEIEATSNLWSRAFLIKRHDVRGTCERSRRLICSVADEGIIGRAVQERLNVSPPASPEFHKECFREYQQKLKAGRKRQVRQSRVMAGLSLLDVQSELTAPAEAKAG